MAESREERLARLTAADEPDDWAALVVEYRSTYWRLMASVRSVLENARSLGRRHG